MDQVLAVGTNRCSGWKLLVAIMFAPASTNLSKLHRPANVFMKSTSHTQFLPTAEKTAGNAPGRRFHVTILRPPFCDRLQTMKITTLLFVTALTAVSPMFGSDTPKVAACGECCDQPECAGLVPAYEKMSTALAADDLTAAQAAATNLACCLKCENQADLAAKVENFSQAASLAEARTLFKGISAAVIPLAEKAGACFIMTCPMAAADWIQTSATVSNPYYGSQMLRCGTIKKTIKAGS